MIVAPTVAGRKHELRRLPGRDMLEHDLQFGKIVGNWLQHALDEDGFAVEHVHRGSVTSPCTHKVMPIVCIASSTG